MDAKKTNCETCGIELEYKTKKRRWCKDCNPYKDVVIYKGHHAKLPQKSQLEYNVENWLKELTKRPYVAGGYFSWLLTEKGYPMQLDILVYGGIHPSFAIEIDGPQHTTQQYFQTKEDFDLLIQHDKLKELLLFQMGIKLIRITECYSRNELLSILNHNEVHL